MLRVWSAAQDAVVQRLWAAADLPPDKRFFVLDGARRTEVALFDQVLVGSSGVLDGLAFDAQPDKVVGALQLEPGQKRLIIVGPGRSINDHYQGMLSPKPEVDFGVPFHFSSQLDTDIRHEMARQLAEIPASIGWDLRKRHELLSAIAGREFVEQLVGRARMWKGAENRGLIAVQPWPHQPDVDLNGISWTFDSIRPMIRTKVGLAFLDFARANAGVTLQWLPNFRSRVHLRFEQEERTASHDEAVELREVLRFYDAHVQRQRQTALGCAAWPDAFTRALRPDVHGDWPDRCRLFLVAMASMDSDAYWKMCREIRRARDEYLRGRMELADWLRPMADAAAASVESLVPISVLDRLSEFLVIGTTTVAGGAIAASLLQTPLGWLVGPAIASLVNVAKDAGGNLGPAIAGWFVDRRYFTRHHWRTVFEKVLADVVVPTLPVANRAVKYT